jgi:hypothetical protein
MQTPSLEHFVGLESRVWDALVRGDEEADRALLTDDFLGVYPTGFATRDEHVGQLSAGSTMAEYAITDARLVPVSPAAVILSYRADFRHVRGGQVGDREVMYISSLWIGRDGEWLNSFSQDTPSAQA